MKLENSVGRTTIAKNKQEDVLAVQKLPRVCQKEEKKGLTDYLKNKDWAGFARHYNGPDYDDYDKKMERAYKRYT